jgi:hypothetical protein
MGQSNVGALIRMGVEYRDLGLVATMVPDKVPGQSSGHILFVLTPLHAATLNRQVRNGSEHG